VTAVAEFQSMRAELYFFCRRPLAPRNVIVSARR
jgi:hypothetical protein